MISVSNIGMAFGDHTLFEGASFQLNPGERYGLIGANGSGKTTLLGILTGDIQSTEGSVSLPKRLRLGVLRQDQFLYEEEPILGVALMGNPELWNAMVEKEEVLARAADHFDADRFSVLEETVQRHDGYTAEARAATILEGLGIPTAVHRHPIRTLSGGFKLRVLLAQVLASNPDVLLLDEPTNHLDILSIRWLETFLADFSGPVVVISHDHRFLDNVATHILDVDYRTVTLYTGDYSKFLDAKVAERERREKDIAGREREIAHHQKFVDRFKAKASKARQAQSKARMIDKISDSMEELPSTSRRYPTFKFEPQRPSGRDVLTLKAIRKSFGDNEVLHGVDLLVNRGDRLAIMGPNGIGKSTLLKIAMGDLTPDAGSVEWGYETHPGYFAQDHKEQFDTPSSTAEEWIWSFCPEKDLGFVRGRMALMLFSGDEAKKRLSTLSGGEAARLVFSRLMLQRPNVLVLDEPTNHLDLESIEALVEGLQTYDGTLILVSHDRWFVGQLANRVVEIRPDGILDYRGTYDEYVHYCGDDHLDADRVILKAKAGARGAGAGAAAPAGGAGAQTAGSGVPKKSGPPAPSPGSNGGAPSPPRTRSKGEIQRLERQREELLARIEITESRVAEIERRFADPEFYDSTPPEEVRTLEAERVELQDRVGTLMEEWEEVEEALGPAVG